AACCRPPVLLVHGFFADASEFVLNPPESSPGMILADTGFDVFLLNVRGTTFSQRHLNMTNDDPESWKFTMDEMAKYDATAAIDKALQLNGASALYWIGHSQGTMLSFLMLADRPEYNAKVRAMFELTPAGRIHNTRGLTKLGFWIVNKLAPILSIYKMLFGSHEFGFRAPWFGGSLSRLVCSALNYEVRITDALSETSFLNSQALSPVRNERICELRRSRFPVYLSHLLVSTSTWNFLHYGQHAAHESILHFDASPAENMRRYGQINPPSYNFSNIDTDIYFFWSRNDWATAPEEIEQWLIPHMGPGVIKGTFEHPEYSHLDFAVATDVADRIFNVIVDIVREYETNACL
ncbi:hypothetical protein PENTCL1PPCAC_8578, partial [Pristionchus entomophagus]